MDTALKPDGDTLSAFAEWITVQARRHGEISLAHFRKGVAVELKSDASPVTVADRDTEAALRSAIEERWPDHGIIGEEFGNKAAMSDWTWSLDPIDGTKSFVAGIPLYTMIISLLYRNEPVLGLIYQPVLDELVWGAQGLGAWYNGVRSQVSGVRSMAQARCLYSDGAMLHRDYPEANRRLLDQVLYSRTWGDGYGYLMVATGRAEIMIDPRMNPWDILPMRPIITEAGGRFTTLDGRDAVGDNCLASNGLVHDAVLHCFAPRSK